MAAALGTGRSFFGLPSRPCNVLYIEVDTPEVVQVPRLRKMKAAPGVWFLFMKPLSLPSIEPKEYDALKSAAEEIKPEVVFLNTLRKVHDMDDKESRTPKIVYSAFQRLFPDSALVFVHHMRKSSQDAKALVHDTEGFSGSNHWLDDAQVGLHLENYHSSKGRENLRLYHRKSQVTEKLRPLPLHLAGDGTTLTSPLFDDLLAIYALMSEWEGSKGELDRLLAVQKSVDPKTIQRSRRLIEHGLFPGSRKFMLKEEELRAFIEEKENGE